MCKIPIKCIPTKETPSALQILFARGYTEGVHLRCKVQPRAKPSFAQTKPTIRSCTFCFTGGQTKKKSNRKKIQQQSLI